MSRRPRDHPAEELSSTLVTVAKGTFVRIGHGTVLKTRSGYYYVLRGIRDPHGNILSSHVSLGVRERTTATAAAARLEGRTSPGYEGGDGTERPMPNFTIDRGLEALGKDLISTRRPYLKAAKIAYLFRPEAPVSNGRVMPGMCVRVDDRNRAVHDHDFLIEIGKDVWDDATDDFRRALLDHELGHCGLRTDEAGQPLKDEQTGRLKTYIKPHDIEEFSDVLEAHGAYHAKLREFLAAHAKGKAKPKPPAEEDPISP